VYPSKMKMPLLFHTLLLHCQSIHDDKMTSLGWSNANSWYRQSQSAVRPSARHRLQIPCLIISVVLSFMALSWLASLGSVRALQGDEFAGTNLKDVFNETLGVCVSSISLMSNAK
jgi:hypothetical protein